MMKKEYCIENYGLKCECCGKVFLASSLNNYNAKMSRKKNLGTPIYCCNDCRLTATPGLNKIEKVKCTQCGKEFKPSINKDKRCKSNNKFCCRSCAAIYNNTHRVFDDKKKEEISKKVSESLKAYHKINMKKEKKEKKISKVNDPKTCIYCGQTFITKKKSQQFCSRLCVTEHRKNDPEAKRIWSEKSRKAGLASAAARQQRSKNEIMFGELCANKFGVDNVLFNKQMFDGWDADVIIENLKIAISWNGAWHYKENLGHNHSLKQVQNRDKIKDDIIKRHGYQHYVIKDMGKCNKAFVENQFESFLENIRKESVSA